MAKAKKLFDVHGGDVRDSLVYGMSDSITERMVDAGAEDGVACKSFVFHGVTYSVRDQQEAVRDALKQDHFSMLVTCPNAVTADVFFGEMALKLKKDRGLRCRKLSDLFLSSLSYEELEGAVKGFDVIFVGLIGPGREGPKRVLRLLADSGISVVVAFRSRYEDRYEKANVLMDHNPHEVDRDHLQYGGWNVLVHLKGAYFDNKGDCRSTSTGEILARYREKPKGA